jgi:hypothetical protein
MVLLNIMDHGHGNQVANAHFTAQEESDLGAAHVILNELLDNVDILLPWLQAR